MRSKLTVALGASVAALATGCVKPPAAEIEAANTAFAAAEAAGAATYATDAYKAAQEAKAQLETEVTVQDEKFALFRSYNKATEAAASAKAVAEQTQQTAASEKERSRTESTRVGAHVLRTPAGIAVAPTHDGEVIPARSQFCAPGPARHPQPSGREATTMVWREPSRCRYFPAIR